MIKVSKKLKQKVKQAVKQVKTNGNRHHSNVKAANS